MSEPGSTYSIGPYERAWFEFFPYGNASFPPKIFADYYIYKKRIEDMQSVKKNFCFHVCPLKHDPISNTPKIGILILGESSRYDHWAINGYNRNTSPLLCKRKDLTIFPDVASVGTHTLASMPYILTRQSVKMNNDFKESSLISLFSQAGYSTTWLTLDKTIVGTSAFGPLSFASEAQRIIIKKKKYDGDLLPVLDSLLCNTKRNSLIVISTNGSHSPYKESYPGIFNIYKPSDHDGFDFKYKQEMINSYDNCIRYSDYFLNTAINICSKQKGKAVALLYIADHGEFLFDGDNPRNFLHGRKACKAECHVPMITWCNQDYQKVFPDKVQIMKQNRLKKISATNVFPTFADFFNIQYIGSQKSNSIVSPCFREKRRYVLYPNAQGFLLYDSIPDYLTD